MNSERASKKGKYWAFNAAMSSTTWEPETLFNSASNVRFLSMAWSSVRPRFWPFHFFQALATLLCLAA